MAAPYVLLSCAMSVDGYIDDTSADRLLLSNPEDFDRVDAARADSDAILIGASAVRRDNPRLLVNSTERRAARVNRGLPEHPLKVTVTGTGDRLDLPGMLADLALRGIGQLMVEGGGSIHTQFLTSGLADEIQLAIAPFFVGQPDAPRFVGPGTFANDLHHRMTLAEVRAIGDVALLRYLPKSVAYQRTL